MKINDFTKGRISCALRKTSLFFNRRKIYRIYWLAALVVSILFRAHTSFAIGPTLGGIESGALNYDEGQTPILITGAITVSDADSPLLASATIQITGNYSPAEDLLKFTDAFSIIGSYDPATGTLTLTGPASLASFESALRSITYQNTNNNNPSNLVRIISFSVNDGVSNSNTASRNINVNRVNDAPIGHDDSFVINEDTSLDCGCLVINDEDLDGDPLINVLGLPPANGTVEDQGGIFIYHPNPDFYGTDTFTYYANDGTENSNETTVTITVLPVNDAPIAVNDAISTDEDSPINLPILSNDIDVDDVLNASMIILVNPPTQGILVINTTTGTVIYTPNLNFNGNDSFTYTVKDASGALSNMASVTITIHPVNDAPVANPDFVTTPKNIAVDIDILLNDYDVDNDIIPSSVVITNNPTHGLVTVNASTGVASFTPETDFLGSDSFTYTIQDPDGLTSAPATVSVSVIVPNRPPHAVDDGPIANSFLSPVTIDVLANDYDEDNEHDELTLVSVTNPSIGTVSIIDGKVLYQPEGTTSATITFTYTIQDPSGLTDEAVVTIEYVYNPLTVSEGFSPNNDNNNETWYILSIENYPTNSVKVFDRWGFLVYQKQHYENTTAPWDGRGNTGQQSGKLLDQGTYYYILEPGRELKTMSGYVVIVR